MNPMALKYSISEHQMEDPESSANQVLDAKICTYGRINDIVRSYGMSIELINGSLYSVVKDPLLKKKKSSSKPTTEQQPTLETNTKPDLPLPNDR
jgi:hypothetical protein